MDLSPVGFFDRELEEVKRKRQQRLSLLHRIRAGDVELVPGKSKNEAVRALLKEIAHYDEQISWLGRCRAGD